MSKRVDNIFRSNISFSKLLLAHKRAKKGKSLRLDVIEFEMDLEKNLISIGEELLKGTYKFGDYREFNIYEPKKRIIKVLPYKDRVVHQLIVVEMLEPIFEKDFIKDSYACIKGRGVHLAVKTLKKYIKKIRKSNIDFWVLKCDIKSYFASIDHVKLYNIIEKRIKDKYFLDFIKKVIFCDKSGRGVPIGNYTSQYFANIYLNVLDKFIKEILKVKYYVRYMDDYVLLLNSKEECIKLKKMIEQKLRELGLELNPKTEYFKGYLGVNFCGYKVFYNKVNIKRKNKVRMKRWFRKIAKDFKNEKIEISDVSKKLPGVRGYLSNCSNNNLINSILDDFVLTRQ